MQMSKISQLNRIVQEVLDVCLVLDDFLHRDRGHVGVRAGQGGASKRYSGDPEGFNLLLVFWEQISW